ncbi:Ferric reductase transmembrane component [Taphrina deformans PYCC 5710]|uniref:ferric-chelate reductase (NADPH) n=1 Tax=Taphrina deformans (strain PYCC 5710 / ATCC 11124 / CBS 356.35 / IMI 108563 / JCM 9778 / NBRC 8474) TaxID=1097556 RepID=R4XE90_TAPDE|nr:Ferric reductase transmembrane component [Taphrina deformans PYCC 5710]|eukprot:CCG81677.1 Ferric reductase transmembrane component [Taphrina deformans PYCC 5710]
MSSMGPTASKISPAVLAAKKLKKLRNAQWRNNVEYFFAACVGIFVLAYILSELRLRLARKSKTRSRLQALLNLTKRAALCSFKVPLVRCRVYLPMLLLWPLVLTFLGAAFLVHTQNFTITTIASRTGQVGAACLPPLFFLSMKNSPIALLIGSSHEKLNIVHRWTGRTVVTTFLVHTITYCVGYAKQGKLVQLRRLSNIYGMAAFAAMLLLAVSSISMARRRHYELFYVLHWVFTILTLAFAWFHDSDNIPYVKASAGIIAGDLVLRIIRVLLAAPYSGAELANINEDLVSLTIPRPRFGPMRTWVPGSHAFLNIPSVTGFHQHHPFTICSIPEDGHIRFVIKKQKGFTDALHKRDVGTVRCLVDGPYGSLEMTRFALFPKVLLIAGGVGITFALPVLRSLLSRKTPPEAITFIWSTNNVSTFKYFEQELRAVQASHEASTSKVELKVKLVFTSRLVSSSSSINSESEVSADIGTDQEKWPVTKDLNEKTYFTETPSKSLFEYVSGRISLTNTVAEELQHIERLAIGVCGPNKLILDAKNTISAQLASSGKDIFLYTEEFEW